MKISETLRNKLKDRPKRFISIRFKITLMVMIITVVTMGLVVMFVNFFLKDIILYNTRSNLIASYRSCNELFAGIKIYQFMLDRSNDEFGEYISNIENPSGATIYIIDESSLKVYSSVVLTDSVKHDLKQILLDTDFKLFKYKKEPYEIREASDSRGRAESLELVGRMDNGNYIVIRCPVERIDSSLTFISRLSLAITFMLILMEMIVMLVFTDRIVHPIKDMSVIARKMSLMDFDAKVNVSNNDEIGELGHSMNELSEKLEHAISDLKTSNLELEKDIERKEEIDEMRKEFLSHVSHELKTPIALVQGYAEGLKDNISDPDNIDFYCDVIIDEAGKMNNLVMKLLDLNELEFGKTDMTIERFDVSKLIMSVIRSSSLLLGKSKAQIEFDEKQEMNVWADQFMIEEVITNYLTNAIHYVKDNGKIRIWYEVKQDCVRVNVYNEGNPIADKDIEKLFIKFYKADVARTREYGGSGIGLSIVAAIMKNHHQDFGVYNADGGVVFYFELDTRGSE